MIDMKRLKETDRLGIMKMNEIAKIIMVML